MSSNYQVLNELTSINNAILLGNKKERNSNIHYNVDELQQFMLVKVIGHKRAQAIHCWFCIYCIKNQDCSLVVEYVFIRTRFGFNIQHEGRGEGEERREKERWREEERKICKYKSEVVIHICISNNQLIWKDWELEGSMDYIQSNTVLKRRKEKYFSKRQKTSQWYSIYKGLNEGNTKKKKKTQKFDLA